MVLLLDFPRIWPNIYMCIMPTYKWAGGASPRGSACTRFITVQGWEILHCSALGPHQPHFTLSNGVEGPRLKYLLPNILEK